jgi:hypothetical protein
MQSQSISSVKKLPARGQIVCDAAKSKNSEQIDINWKRQERLLNEALEETFPASDPISPYLLGSQDKK